MTTDLIKPDLSQKEEGSEPVAAPSASGRGALPTPSGWRRALYGELPMMVAASLRSDSAWVENYHSGKTYTIRHLSGLDVWVANRTYGMAIQMHGSTVWGGVTGWSSFGLSPGHRYLRRAADQWLDCHGASNAARVAAALRPASGADGQGPIAAQTEAKQSGMNNETVEETHVR